MLLAAEIIACTTALSIAFYTRNGALARFAGVLFLEYTAIYSYVLVRLHVFGITDYTPWAFEMSVYFMSAILITIPPSGRLGAILALGYMVQIVIAAAFGIDELRYGAASWTAQVNLNQALNTVGYMMLAFLFAGSLAHGRRCYLDRRLDACNDSVETSHDSKIPHLSLGDRRNHAEENPA